MNEFENLETMPEKLEDNSIIVYSNGSLKQITLPEYGEIILKSNDGKVLFASCTKKYKW